MKKNSTDINWLVCVRVCVGRYIVLRDKFNYSIENRFIDAILATSSFDKQQQHNGSSSKNIDRSIDVVLLMMTTIASITRTHFISFHSISILFAALSLFSLIFSLLISHNRAQPFLFLLLLIAIFIFNSNYFHMTNGKA